MNFLTPDSCVRACQAIQYNLGAIQDGKWCFCKQSSIITSLQTQDSNCTAISCSGDSTLACGANGLWIVYEAGASVNVSCIFKAS